MEKHETALPVEEVPTNHVTVIRFYPGSSTPSVPDSKVTVSETKTETEPSNASQLYFDAMCGRLAGWEDDGKSAAVEEDDADDLGTEEPLHLVIDEPSD